METAAVRYNLDKLLALAGKTPLWAVHTRSRGPGRRAHGPAVLGTPGIRRFAVTEVAEALEIRGAFAQAEILMLRPTADPEELQQLLDLDVIATISCSAEAAALNSLALQRARWPRSM